MRNLWIKLRSKPMGYAVLYIASKIYLVALYLVYAIRRVSPSAPGSIPGKVISVGNLSSGGTGKTAFTHYLSRNYLMKGEKVCVLSRGYKGGDEAKQLADSLKKHFPAFCVETGADRYQGAVRYINAHKNGHNPVFILDDGHQYHGIRKDLNIVLIDAIDHDQNRNLLPLGLLREPFEPAIKRADIAIITHADLAGKGSLERTRKLINGSGARVPVFEAVHEPLDLVSLADPAQHFPLERIEGENIVLFSGIGNPRSFEDTVARKTGAAVSRHFIFEDHAGYAQRTINDIARWSRENNASWIITTSKDAARLRALENLDTSP
ncbi:tetraacyldisaccharide 4'-kinase, partial [Elusimicrobiota bacterium]